MEQSENLSANSACCASRQWSSRHAKSIPTTSVSSINSRIEKRNIGGLLWTAFYRGLAAHSQANLGCQTADRRLPTKSHCRQVVCFFAVATRFAFIEVAGIPVPYLFLNELRRQSLAPLADVSDFAHRQEHIREPKG